MITTKPSYPTTYDRAIDIAMRSGFGQNVNLPPQGYRATVDQALRFSGTKEMAVLG